MNAGILTGMRVVEAAAFVAAPLGGMTLAQLGADVIRIDPLDGGLDHRRWPLSATGASLFWCGLNKGKRSVALDLRSPEGQEIAQALACAPGEDGGIFLSNFPARGWLDHGKLKARRADLIQFTLQGDRHGRSAVDYTVNARVGIPFFTGTGACDTPVNHVLPTWDLITGHMIAVGLLAAERHRRKTGEGQHVKVALEDVALAAVSYLGWVEEARQGHPRQRHGNDLFGAFGRDFVTADGVRIMLVGLTLKQWQGICEALEIALPIKTIEQQTGIDLTLEGERFKARESLNQIVELAVARRRFDELSPALERNGVCWGRYQTIEQLANDDPECSIGNPLFQEIHQGGIGDMLAAGNPLEFSTVARPACVAAPTLGEDTEAVLLELLGVDAAQFGRLHDTGVVR
jgi:2-methylfumaryl-CoA isomerase